MLCLPPVMCGTFVTKTKASQKSFSCCCLLKKFNLQMVGWTWLNIHLKENKITCSLNNTKRSKVQKIALSQGDGRRCLSLRVLSVFVLPGQCSYGFGCVCKWIRVHVCVFGGGGVWGCYTGETAVSLQGVAAESSPDYFTG